MFDLILRSVGDLLNIIQIFGSKIIQFYQEAGRVAILFVSIIKNLPSALKYHKLFFHQAFEIGVHSLLLVISIAFFTGAVLAYQSAEHMVKLMPLTFLGVSTYKMMTLELGPVLTGVIMAGRYGASVSAELGTMRVTEQISALESMAIDPVKYLAVPRFLASLLMLPICVIFADVTGIFSGFMIANTFFNVSTGEYFNEIQNFFKMKDIVMGLVKTLVFGGIISLIGCYVGFNTYGGAEGVGRATVRAFVISSVLILIADLLVAMMIL